MNVSLQEKKGTYYAVFRVTDANGKETQKWVSTKIKADGRHKREAKKEAQRIAAEYEAAKTVDYKKITFDEWILEWLQQKKTEVDSITYSGYESYAKNHIIPYYKYKKIQLQKLTPHDIQTYYNDKSKLSTDKEGAGLSGKSLRNHHVVIRGALESAVRENIIPFNPADRVKLPKKEKFVGCAYTLQETQSLLEIVRGTTIEDIVTVTVHYGLRKSEALGLKWSAIDFEKGTLEIKSTVVRFSKVVEKDRTKNQSSHRTYPITTEMAVLLKKIRLRQSENRLLSGECYHVSDYVFTWPDGRPFTPDYVSRKFSQVIAKGGLPHVRFHDLRHTTASLLISNGYSMKHVQEWLGHGDIGTTMNIYSHLDFAEKVEVADGIGKLFQKSSNKSSNKNEKIAK